MKRYLFLSVLPTLAISVLWLGTASADAIGLSLAPLEYQQTISAKTPQQGFIGVSNPSDSPVSVTTSVQGFRQTDSSGDLAYYDDAQLSAAITPDLPTFTLSARQAINMAFTVDPRKLPAGGVYAVIFFQTVPAAQSSASSYVSESAKVGTLLILNNGGVKAVGGTATLSVSHWQFGDGLTGSASYSVANGQVGLTPSLTTKIYGWGKSTSLKTGLVLPGATRNFALSRPGSYFGIIPIELNDGTTGRVTTTWVIAITGWYQTLVVFIIGLIAAWLLRRWRRPRHAGKAISRSLDGLSKQ